MWPREDESGDALVARAIGGCSSLRVLRVTVSIGVRTSTPAFPAPWLEAAAKLQPTLRELRLDLNNLDSSLFPFLSHLSHLQILDIQLPQYERGGLDALPPFPVITLPSLSRLHFQSNLPIGDALEAVKAISPPSLDALTLSFTPPADILSKFVKHGVIDLHEEVAGVVKPIVGVIQSSLSSLRHLVLTRMEGYVQVDNLLRQLDAALPSHVRLDTASPIRHEWRKGNEDDEEFDSEEDESDSKTFYSRSEEDRSESDEDKEEEEDRLYFNPFRCVKLIFALFAPLTDWSFFRPSSSPP